MQETNEAAVEVFAWLGLAILGGILTAAARWLRPDLFAKLLPPQRRRAVPWSEFEIGFVFFCTFILIPEAVQGVFRLKFYPLIYGSDFPDIQTPIQLSVAEQLAKGRLILWSSVLACPVQVGAILALLYLGSGTRPYQLGLDARCWPQRALLGFFTWLVLTPCVLAINLLVAVAFSFFQLGLPEMHPLEQLVKSHPGIVEWALIFLLASVAAPIVEELLFRGLVQPWLARRSWGGEAALAGAFAVALFFRSEQIKAGFDQGDIGATLGGLAAALFVLAMIPGFVFIEPLLWRWLPDPYVARAIYGTSLLFAAFHSFAWPSPIALFPLGFGLGFLAYRTQNLIGPMVVHALFNTVSCLMMLFITLRS